MESVTLAVREEFVAAVRERQIDFDLALSDDVIERLADYYELVQEHNPILHLVGPCSPTEFATRHILESLTLLEFLPVNARFADIGAGAGLPSIPCLIAREDLDATLIESKEKKAIFLRNAIAKLGMDNRAIIVDRQFAEARLPEVSYITCRALDKFTQKLPQLLKWSAGRTLLLFGGPGLNAILEENGIKFDARLMPMSSQRFLFVAKMRRR